MVIDENGVVILQMIYSTTKVISLGISYWLLLFVCCCAISCAEILPPHVTWIEAYLECHAVADLRSFLGDGDRHRHHPGTSPAAAVCSLFNASIKWPNFWFICSVAYFTIVIVFPHSCHHWMETARSNVQIPICELHECGRCVPVDCIEQSWDRDMNQFFCSMLGWPTTTKCYIGNSLTTWILCLNFVNNS